MSTVSGTRAQKACESHEFTFTDCMYTVGKGEKAKTLIAGISGSVKSGFILSIMGPSGAAPLPDPAATPPVSPPERPQVLVRRCS